MRAICISIGDELLYGQTLDTNTHWLSQKFSELGIRVIERITISDSIPEIQRVLNDVIHKVEIVTLTGGLGPTQDDCTKTALADFFNVELVEDAEVWEDVQAYFKNRGKIWTDLNYNQALIPSNCVALKNKLGTAPGMYFFEQNCHIVSLPGVPFEMKYLFEEQFVPVLKQKVVLPELYHAYFLTAGKGESILAQDISEVVEQIPKAINLAYLPHLGCVSLRLSMESNSKISKDTFNTYSTLLERKLRELGDFVTRQPFATLSSHIIELLNSNNLKIGFAESCTGGLLAHLLTQYSGISSVYNGSVVTYSNTMKNKLLGVSIQTLDEFGAVSEAVVMEMVNGACSVLECDVSIAISGVAGPDGGTESKPIGMVCIAVGSLENSISKTFQFAGTRSIIMERACQSAYFMLIRWLEAKYPTKRH